MGKSKPLYGKQATVERYGLQIGTPGKNVQFIQVTFDSYVVKVILASFGAFPIFYQLVS